MITDDEREAPLPHTAVHNFDAVVLGAGAAGLLCAIEAGKRGRRIAVLERADRAGKKILISGGGRCNFTNLHCQPENFISANPHFAKSALARYTPADFIALVEKHRIPYHEKTLGQLFCDGSAHEITGMLEAESQAAGVQVFLKSVIREVARTTEFIVRTDAGEFHAPAVVVATGGLSIPKMGATAFGYDLARQFGLKIREPRPALVPLVLGERDRNQYCDLTGVSTEVVVAADHQSFREKMLITHRGLSGPAILQISSYWREDKAIRIDLAPDCDVTAAIRESKVRNWPRRVPHFRGSCRNDSRRAGLIRMRQARGPTRHWPNWSARCMNGFSNLRARKATKKPRSQPAASIPMNYRAGRWKAGESPDCFSSAKSWMSPAIWAASTFNGPGPQARRREESYRCETSKSARDRPKVLQRIAATLRGSGGHTLDQPIYQDLATRSRMRSRLNLGSHRATSAHPVKGAAVGRLMAPKC